MYFVRFSIYITLILCDEEAFSFQPAVMSGLVVLRIDAVRLDIEIPQDLDLVVFYHLLWFEVVPFLVVHS